METTKLDGGRALAAQLSDDNSIRALQLQNAELLTALRRFVAYGDVFAYRPQDGSPYQQALDAIAAAEATETRSAPAARAGRLTDDQRKTMIAAAEMAHALGDFGLCRRLHNIDLELARPAATKQPAIVAAKGGAA